MKEWARSPSPGLGPAQPLCLGSPSCKTMTVSGGARRSGCSGEDGAASVCKRLASAVTYLSRLSVKLSGGCAPRRPYLTKKALSFIPQIVGNLDQVWT